MNVNTLHEFRHAVYASFKRAGDALFNTVDALSSEAAAQSFPELSQSPFFERKWPSLYEALEDGQIEVSHLRQVFLSLLPFRVQVSMSLWESIPATCTARKP